MTCKLVCALLLLPLSSPSQTFPSRAQDKESAIIFVQQVYADYANPDDRHREERQSRFYTPRLYRLIVAAEKGHPGYVGKLDGDPICDCQDAGDPGELKVQSITLSATRPVGLKAVVAFFIAKDPVTVTLSLLRTSDGWRVDDIATKDTPSTRKYLRNTKNPVRPK